MIADQDYITLSFELHLFFARIMKEHAIFIMAALSPVNEEFAEKAEVLKKEFEHLLILVLNQCQGFITEAVLESQEIVTDYTLGTEQKTHLFTGIDIHQEITRMELKLYYTEHPSIDHRLINIVRDINRTAAHLIDLMITFNMQILQAIQSCDIVSALYPTFYDHILHECKEYQECVEQLEEGLYPRSMIPPCIEEFWTHIMLEHGAFLRGLLDPKEFELISTANDFVGAYGKIISEFNITPFTDIEQSIYEETVKFQQFNTEGVKGISSCKIKSIILPLIADHILREANHFLRLMREGKKQTTD
ncbi:MAG TPA: DUF2935 domain-containing protein [Candidatus Merdenecus merdavium]|nr:DUF2935 domain-containing protein [Candidatus Merdenecus merdavium]